jgi:hypothetical protein
VMVATVGMAGQEEHSACTPSSSRTPWRGRRHALGHRVPTAPRRCGCRC